MAAAKEAEALFVPLKWSSRRKPFGMYCTAFGWGFLMTGIATGGQLAGALTWSEALIATIVGNMILVVIASLCAAPGQQTGMGNSPVYMFTFGKLGFYLPAIILTIAVIGWQGAVIGMLTQTWTGMTTGPIYVIVAIVIGVLAMFTTYAGIGFIEKIAIPATFVLVAVGFGAIFYAIHLAGGFASFVELANASAAQSESKITVYQGISMVVGAWIAGSCICTEITRFAKTRFVAMTMVIIGLPLCQIFLNILGYVGQVGGGSYDFTVYMKQAGPVVWIVSLLALTIALWSSLDVNLYFPATMFSFMVNIPRKGGVLVTGIVGTIMAAFGLFNYYGNFLNLMAAILPALAGPVVAEFFIVNRGRWDTKLLHKLPKLNIASILAYAFGIIMQYTTCPPVIPQAIWAFVWALIGSVVFSAIFKAAKKPQGYQAVKHLETEPMLPQEDDSQLGDYDANFIHYDSKT